MPVDPVDPVVVFTPDELATLSAARDILKGVSPEHPRVAGVAVSAAELVQFSIIAAAVYSDCAASQAHLDA